MEIINKQDLIKYLKKSPENLNFNIFGTMLEDFRNTYETDEQIVSKIKGIITDIVNSGESISVEDDTITELVDLVIELLPEKMIIKPDGTLSITENGEYDVMNKAEVNVDVPQPTGTISITQNGTANVNDYEYADVNVVDPLGNLTRNNVTNLKLSEGPTNIEDQMFKNCTNLEEITIPNSVTTLGSEAFSGCTNLTTVNGGFGVQTIGENAFYNCPSVLYSGTIGDCKWAQYNGTLTVDGNGNMADNPYGGFTRWKDNIKIIINNGVTNIGNNAFYYCSKLNNIDIPNSVTNIGDSAFRNCSRLDNIDIPDSVTSIGSDAFDGTAWFNNQPDGLVYAGKVAYKYKGTMPANSSITIKNGTKGIANSAFKDRTGLTSVTIPDGVTSIGEWAFYYCTGLTSVTIGNNVTSIGKYAFQNCTGLTSVIIPDSVTSIDSSAFKYDSGLTDVYYTGTQEEWNAITINGSNESLTNATIHYNYIPSN